MPLDIVQSVAFMSFAAGGTDGLKFPLAGQPNMSPSDCLATFLNGGTAPDGSSFTGFFQNYNLPTSAYALIGGDWKVVWGPVAMLQPNTTSGAVVNAMYVAYSANESTYVVSIAGTNFSSVYDWVDEDFKILKRDLVPWPIGSNGASGAAISGATANGLTNLLSMDDPKNGTLKSFLDGLTSKGGDTLVFTGHSLGGALSPTLAFNLYPSPSLVDSGWKDVFVLPLAGPTPGNKVFTGQFNAAYAPATSSSTCAGWNTNCRNSYDLVPRAWNDLLGAIPWPIGEKNSQGIEVYKSIWGYVVDGVKHSLLALVAAAEVASKGAGYGDVTPAPFDASWGRFVPGPIQPPVDGAWSPTWTPWPAMGPENPILHIEGMTSKDYTSDCLGNLLISAHVDQYFQHFGVGPLPALPQSAEQLAAAQDEALRKQLVVSMVGLRSTGVPVRRQR